MENTIFSTLSEQMAVEKGTQNTANSTDKLRGTREEKEQQQATMQHECVPQTEEHPSEPSSPPP